MLPMFRRLLAILAVLAGWSVEGDETLRHRAKVEFGMLEPVPPHRLSAPDVLLGRRLFWDPRLSADGRTACVSCHLPQDWGADRRPFSRDARGRDTARNSQTVFNALLQPSLRWTGDRTSGVHQAVRSLTGSMGLDHAEAVVPLFRKLDYESAFKAAFPEAPDPLTPTHYGRALQAYQETLRTPAPFDRFLAGDDAALTPPQKEGLRVFLRVGCADCHDGPLLGGSSIRKFGTRKDYWLATRSTRADAGLYETTRKEADRHRFRVSMLRNVAATPPYFHDGSVTNLQEAVQVMADVQFGARLDDPDAQAIAAFLESLTGEVPAHYAAPDGPPH